MMFERLLRTGSLCIVLAVSGPAHLNVTTQQPPPVSKTYILSQATCLANPVHVPLGAIVQVQLPGNHAPKGKWEFVAPFPKNLKLTSVKIIDSKGRIPGLDAIYIFNFSAAFGGPATITMRATPPISVTYPNLKNPDPIKCPTPTPTPQNGQQTYKLETLNYYLIVDLAARPK